MFKASLFMGAGALLHAVGSRFMTDMGGLRKNMRKTYIFMLLASLSLAAGPSITAGFWSKDAIFWPYWNQVMFMHCHYLE